MIDPRKFEREEIIDIRAVVGEYEFSLTRLAEHLPIRIKIWCCQTHPPNRPYTYTISHNVQTPVEESPYRSNDVFAESEEEAVNKAILHTLLNIHRYEKIEAGWLVLNADFR